MAFALSYDRLGDMYVASLCYTLHCCIMSASLVDIRSNPPENNGN